MAYQMKMAKASNDPRCCQTNFLEEVHFDYYNDLL